MRSSAARPSQAAAAASIGADPGPAYMSPELISGGNAPKSIGISLSSTRFMPGALQRRHFVRRRLVQGGGRRLVGGSVGRLVSGSVGRRVSGRLERRVGRDGRGGCQLVRVGREG